MAERKNMGEFIRANFKTNVLKEFRMQESEFRMIASGVKSARYVILTAEH